MTPTFEAPGPGRWALDRSHYPGGTTPISQWLIGTSMAAGTERVFAELGVPVRCVSSGFVHGFMYTRVRPLVGADRPTRRPPPRLVLQVVARLLPEFRRRAERAAITLEEMPSIQVARRWHRETRHELVAANLAFQRVAVDELDDAALEEHIAALLDHARDNFERHFWLHGHDLGPLARFVHACEGWGIRGSDAVVALTGASPSTAEPAAQLCELRRLLDGVDHEITSLDDLRAASPDAARLLDAYLERRGNVLASGYDLTSWTLAELPDVVLDSIRHARPVEPLDPAVVERLRSGVPANERIRFDEYLAHAREVMDMRDDNGPLTAEWPVGLLRRALLEAGRRLAERGRLDDADLALELEPDEARRLLTGAIPGGETIAARRRRRLAAADVVPPEILGPDEPEPPIDILPDPLPTLVAMVQTVLHHMGMDATPGDDDVLTGVGVGRAAYVGRVCRAGSADEAIEQLEPGDVLVVRATSPAFNAVLAVAGAVVTADGGAMSHAAVLARELGIPAVVGARGALDLAHGVRVEVDPVAGRVTPLGE